MKKLPIFILIGVIALVGYSMVHFNGKSIKIKASKNTATETKTIYDEFDKIEVEGIFEVDVTYGSEEKIEIEAPDNVLKHINLKVKSGTLIVELTKNTSVNTIGGFKVHISTAKLNGFSISGASSIKLNNSLKDKTFTLESSGAAKFTGDVEVETATIELSGATHVNLTGTASTAHLNISGASHLKDYDFKIDNLNVDLSGASSTKVTSLKSINGDVSGASSLIYKGDPSIKRLSKSGAASISPN